MKVDAEASGPQRLISAALGGDRLSPARRSLTVRFYRCGQGQLPFCRGGTAASLNGPYHGPFWKHGRRSTEYGVTRMPVPRTRLAEYERCFRQRPQGAPTW